MDLSRPVATDPYTQLPPVGSFTVTSEDVADGQTIAEPFTGAKDISPQLYWAGFQASTRSFVLTCFDPDAPRPGGFWHWAVLNLSAATTSLPQGAGAPDGSALPDGAVQTTNDGGARAGQRRGAHQHHALGAAADDAYGAGPGLGSQGAARRPDPGRAAALRSAGPGQHGGGRRLDGARTRHARRGLPVR